MYKPFVSVIHNVTNHEAVFPFLVRCGMYVGWWCKQKNNKKTFLNLFFVVFF